MMHYSGNAETDFLIGRLGAERVSFVMQTGGLANHTPIVPILGITLVMFNHEAAFSMTELEKVMDEVAQGNFETLQRLTDLYLNDPEWRSSQIAFMTAPHANTTGSADRWAYPSNAGRLFPKGTAREYARLMAQIASGRFISAEISEIMQQELETLASDAPLRLLFFDRFGAKDGVTAGVLTLAAYALPRRGDLRGRSRVTVVLANGMPAELWAVQAQFQGHYLLPLDLLLAKGEFARLSEVNH
jgi:D-alanyl-D-alanine carboxypeptidase